MASDSENVPPCDTSPLRQRALSVVNSAGASPHTIHKQYWDNLYERHMSSSPLKAMVAHENDWRVSSPGDKAMKAAARSPLGASKNRTINNPLFASPKSGSKGGRSPAASALHGSKENSAPSPKTRAVGPHALGGSAKKLFATAAVLENSKQQSPLSSAPAPFGELSLNMLAGNRSPLKGKAREKVRIEDAFEIHSEDTKQTPSEQVWENQAEAAFGVTFQPSPQYSPNTCPFSPRPAFTRGRLSSAGKSCYTPSTRLSETSITTNEAFEAEELPACQLFAEDNSLTPQEWLALLDLDNKESVQISPQRPTTNEVLATPLEEEVQEIAVRPEIVASDHKKQVSEPLPTPAAATFVNEEADIDVNSETEAEEDEDPEVQRRPSLLWSLITVCLILLGGLTAFFGERLVPSHPVVTSCAEWWAVSGAGSMLDRLAPVHLWHEGPPQGYLGSFDWAHIHKREGMEAETVQDGGAVLQVEKQTTAMSEGLHVEDSVEESTRRADIQHFEAAQPIFELPLEKPVADHTPASDLAMLKAVYLATSDTPLEVQAQVQPESSPPEEEQGPPRPLTARESWALRASPCIVNSAVMPSPEPAALSSKVAAEVSDHIRRLQAELEDSSQPQWNSLLAEEGVENVAESQETDSPTPGLVFAGEPVDEAQAETPSGSVSDTNEGAADLVAPPAGDSAGNTGALLAGASLAALLGIAVGIFAWKSGQTWVDKGGPGAVVMASPPRGASCVTGVSDGLEAVKTPGEVLLMSPAQGASPYGRYQAFVEVIKGEATDSPQRVLTPVQRSRRIAERLIRENGASSSPVAPRRFFISPEAR